MSTLAVTIVQAELHWHDAAANREMFSGLLGALDTKTDLIVLPEMFTTGFTMDAPGMAEGMNGESVNWMIELSAQVEASICGSLIILDDGAYFNRFICARPNGELVTYDKRHLFRLADEHNHYSPGSEIITFEVNGWKVCPMVCYDLRFPVWSRNRNNYDLLLYVANWPERRHLAWQTLLRARAIENLSYVAGVNRVGRDGNNLPYAGGSSIIDYFGKDLVNLDDVSGIATATLNAEDLQSYRKRFAFHMDADEFNLGRG